MKIPPYALGSLSYDYESVVIFAATILLSSDGKYRPPGRRMDEEISSHEDVFGIKDHNLESEAAGGKKRASKELTMLQQDCERAGIAFDFNSIAEDSTTARTRQKRRATSIEHYHLDEHVRPTSQGGESKKILEKNVL
jgi:hypothetical protein